MQQYLKQFATSKWFDVIGVVLVVSIAIAAGYLNTRLEKYVDWGPWTSLVPFGIISVINVGISMLSTRFTGKLSNWGNYLSYYIYHLHICHQKMERLSCRRS